MLTEEDCRSILAGIGEDVVATGDVGVITAYGNIMAEGDSDVERLTRFLMFMQTHVKHSSEEFVEYALSRLNNIEHVGERIDSAQVAFPSGRERLSTIDLREVSIYPYGSGELREVLADIAAVLDELPPPSIQYKGPTY